MRKEIKKNNNLSAKQIMKEVSKSWQEIKDDKQKTQKYEYLSLRDREAYALLCRYCQSLKHSPTSDDQHDVHVSLRSFEIVNMPQSDNL